MPYVPHTADDVQRLLKRLGLDAEDDLFTHIPPSIISEGFSLPEPSDEENLKNKLAALARLNRSGMCFAGGGAYHHHIPAAVDALSSRSEFLTAYTPYQPETSQGGLQAIYEYQTMIASLCGLDVANASMYDGATALYEAVLMSVRITRRWKTVVDQSVNPLYRQTLRTYARNLGIDVIEIPFLDGDGTPDLDALADACDEETASVVVSQPNYFGFVSDYSSLFAAVKEKGVLGLVQANPVALALVESPGAMGADIVCGEAQPLGLPLSWGGPYLGFLAAGKKHVRRMPGRIVGATQDARGHRGFVLTLQTREQHIRREKAVSNICSNQAHCALRACIYLTLVGRKGLEKIAAASMHNARLLREQIGDRVTQAEFPFPEGARFNEFAVRLSCDAEKVVSSLAQRGIAAGIPLARHYPELGEGALLLAATEATGESEIKYFADALAEELH